MKFQKPPACFRIPRLSSRNESIICWKITLNNDNTLITATAATILLPLLGRSPDMKGELGAKYLCKHYLGNKLEYGS